MSEAPIDHNTALGLTIVRASGEEVVLEWQVRPEHHQPMGIVHGGVHCTAVETACSIGAGLSVRARDPSMTAVGLENHTSFLRAVREGKLTCTARPLNAGRSTQLWQAEIRDEQDRLIAAGTVRLMCVARDAGFKR